MRRGQRAVVSQADFSAGFGVHAVLGPNGAGKSSLFGAIAGQLSFSGSLTWDGSEFDDTRRRSIGMGWLPQESRFPASMTVREVLEYAAWARRLPRRGVAVARAVDVGAVGTLADRRVGQLSGGERRRVALAAAAVGGPGLMLLDEPTTGLDPLQRDGFHEIIQGLGKERVVLLATHLLEDVAATADRIILLIDGQVRFAGRVEEFTPDAGRSVESLRRAFGARVGDGE